MLLLRILLIVIPVLLTSSTIEAAGDALCDFQTNGGYVAITNAFKRVALIFSNATYIKLFYFL